MSVLAERLIEALGAESVHTEPEDLAVYSFDAYSEDRLPSAAVIPKDVREVTQVVRIAADCGEPIVARGAGTGLCGGAVPTHGGIVVSFARMNRILEIDTRNRRAKVEPGLINLDLSRATARDGLFYAPDPSSQKVSSLGGNIATNAGGPHCLSYGTTTNHVIGLEYVDHRGEVVTVHQDDPGYDLAGVLVGSEGTLGIVTSIDLRLMRLPEAVRVCVATFGDVESASEAVSQVIGAGIVPIALEIMDKVITGAVEAAFKAGYPEDAGAVLLVEIAGLADDMDASEAAIAKMARACGALSWRAARSQAERDLLWAARKGAAGAIGRLAPNYYIQDCTVPRTKLPMVMHRIEEIARDHQLAVGNVFHAGDGNLHPLLLFDRSRPRDIQAVIDAGSQILRTCIDYGGTISGEHGIGYEKRESLALLFSADDLATMGRVRDVLDPARRFNPDKIFPTSAMCGEVRAAS
ncbi:MAG TPA: FAD-linked oxidase C-terminal domain-containing protein [Candidatus Acidoferrales bacterium]|nr:FAD-linked oxidase C-terminal domain-containing protein [Candidatus Acidoferrales bacterium]